MDFRVRRPCYQYIRADPRAQQQFHAALEKRLQHLTFDWLVFTLDEATLQLLPTLSWKWALKGTKVEIPTYGSHPKTHLFAAINQTYLKVHYYFVTKQNSFTFKCFVYHLLELYPGKKILLLIDNARFHTSEETKRFFDYYSERLEVLFFPKYSPKLNPTEQLFRWLRREVTHNYFFETLEDLLTSAKKFLVKASNTKKELKRRRSLNV